MRAYAVVACPCRSVIDTLLETLPATFANNACVESAMGPALQV